MGARYSPEFGYEAEDTAILLLGFDGGGLAEVTYSVALHALATQWDPLFTLVGTEGVLSGDEARLEFRPASWDHPARHRLSQLRGESAWLDTFRLEVAHFLDVLEGVAAPIATVDDARRTLDVIHAAYASIESGATVALRAAPSENGAT
jgi:predicted dehydrogenase